jgi:hypothetical protein
MASIITRLYDSNDTASAAVAALKKDYFPARDIATIDGSGDAFAALTAFGVAKTAAKAFAAKLAQGGSAVVVRASFGSAEEALTILSRFGPTKVMIPDTYDSADMAAPFSDTFGFPVLSSNPTPLSSLLGLPVLRQGKSTTQLMDNPAPLSKLFGLPLLKRDKSTTKLINNPGPLSRSIGLPLLTRGKSTTSLLNSPTPLSSLLGLPVLWK